MDHRQLESQLSHLSSVERARVLRAIDTAVAEIGKELIGCKPPAIVITSDLEVWEPLLQACQKHEVALLRTSESTSSFVALASVFDALQTALIEETGFVNEQFALTHPGGAVGERLNKK